MTEKERIVENIKQHTGKSDNEVAQLIKKKIQELGGLVSEEGALYIIANELGIKIELNKIKTHDTKLADIQPRQNIHTVCKVSRIYDLVTFGENKQVRSLLAVDDTKTMRIVFWNEQASLLAQVQPGDIIKVVSAYSKENNGNIEIHIGTQSEIFVNPEGVELSNTVQPVEQGPQTTNKKIVDLKEGEKNIQLEGVITDFEIPRFYEGCPECFKKVNEGNCPTHGQVTPLQIPIINISFDDGSGQVTLTAFRDRAELLSQLTSQQLIQLTENITFYRNYVKQLLGKKLSVTGNVSMNSITGDLQVIVSTLPHSEASIDTNSIFKQDAGVQPDLEISSEEAGTDDPLNLDEININDI